MTSETWLSLPYPDISPARGDRRDLSPDKGPDRSARLCQLVFGSQGFPVSLLCHLSRALGAPVKEKGLWPEAPNPSSCRQPHFPGTGSSAGPRLQLAQLLLPAWHLHRLYSLPQSSDSPAIQVRTSLRLFLEKNLWDRIIFRRCII